MASVTVSPSPYVMALVTMSLVSRIAMSGSTGTCQAWRAARTRPRASAAEDGSLASRTRRWYSSVERVGAITMIRFLSVLGALALKIVLQFAMQDIGQLTDIEPRRRPRATHLL